MLQIFEIKPNTYKVPSIDNRNRKGYAMFQTVTSTFGSCKAQLHKLNGTVENIGFSVTGWFSLDNPTQYPNS